jgi:hypothetical protein
MPLANDKGGAAMTRTMTRIIQTACAATLIGPLLVSPLLLSSTGAQTQQQRMKECAAQWGAMKAAGQAQGKTYRSFQQECLSNRAAAPNSGARTTAPQSTTTTGQGAAPAPTPPAAAPARRTVPAKAAPAEPTGAGQFATEVQAKAHCPGDTVVWANLDSRIYHYSGNRSYGATKKGAYMCERETANQGIRAARNEKRP